MSVSKKRVGTKRTTLHFVVGNEQRFALLLGTNNALRIFMVFSETKSALVIKNFSTLLPIHREILIFLVFVSSGDLTKISGNMTQVSGEMTRAT